MQAPAVSGSPDSERSEGYPAWLDAYRNVFSSMLRANKAALTMMGFKPATSSSPSHNGKETVDEGWEVERTVDEREEIQVGDTVEFTKALTDEDIRRFAAASGDTNPLHLDEEFAGATRFEDRIVHGTLVSGLISAALARLPGLIVYVSQETRFLSPVEVGDRLTARCEVAEEVGEDLFRISTDILDQDGETVVDGEAVVLVEEEPPDVGLDAE